MDNNDNKHYCDKMKDNKSNMYYGIFQSNDGEWTLSGEYWEIRHPIEYCPFCGKKLEM